MVYLLFSGGFLTMRKHTKAGFALLMAGMMMAGSVTSALAATDATAATSGVIDTTKKTEVTGPGSTAASTETTSDGHTFSTEAPGSTTTETSGASQAENVQTTAPESTSASEASQDVTSGQDNALTEDQANQLESEQAAAEAEAEASHTGPLSVPLRQPRLQTTVLLNDSHNWSGAFVNDQQITTDGVPFSSISTFLENIFGNVLYRAYNSSTGWTGWALNGQQTFFDGNAWHPVEAIQYRFAGPVNDQYDIYYSALLSDGTQTGWGKNGETVGTMNTGLYLTGFRLAYFAKNTASDLDTSNTLKSAHADGIQYVDGQMRYIHGNGDSYTGWGWLGSDRYYFKDSVPVTGWQYIDGLKYYFGEDGKMWSDVESLLGSDGPYLIKINKEMNCMTIYAQDGGNGYIIPVKSFLTSVGDDTPVGTFKTPEKYRWRLMIHDVYTQYATRLGAGLPILIHSIIYDAANPMTVWASTYNNMGIARSAGCIRLVSGDAKWVYDHCALGTTVQVYNSSVAGPFERPTIAAEIPFEQTWDPSDPNVTQDMINAETARILAKFQNQ
jgi:hypothetical protein